MKLHPRETASTQGDHAFGVLVDGELAVRLLAPGGNVLDVEMMTGASTFTAGEPTTLVIVVDGDGAGGGEQLQQDHQAADERELRAHQGRQAGEERQP